MTKTHRRWFLHFFRLHHGFSLLVKSALLYPPWAAAQTELPPPPPPPIGFPHKITVNPAITIALFCLVSSFFLLCFVSIYVRQCIERPFTRNVLLANNEVRAGHRSTRRRGLDPELIDAFPTFMYSEVKGLKIGKGSLECAVCLNEFEDDELLQLLPKCSHVFHPDCIGTWLSSHITCPVCRADCSPDRSETFPVTLPSDQDSGFGESELGFSPDNDIDDHNPQRLNSNRMVDDDLVTHAQSPEAITGNNIQTKNQNFPVRNAKKQVRRSQSTGLTLVQPCENCQRFTLRLPEEVRNQLVMNSTTLSRSKSCVAFPRAASARKGYRSSSVGNGSRRNMYNYERVDRDGRSNRWGRRVTPPSFLNCAGSTGSPVGSGGEGSTSSGKTLLKSVTLPLQRLFGGTDGNKENTNAGERPVDRLRLDDRV